MSFSEDEKRECCMMLSIGCDRERVCHFLGKSNEELHERVQSDADFRRRVRRAEATPEVSHLKNLYNAAKDEKNWRASVWWLEHCVPERYGRRSPASLTVDQVEKFVDGLASSIADQVHDEHDRSRLLLKIQEIAGQLSDAPAEQSCHQPAETLSTEGDVL